MDDNRWLLIGVWYWGIIALTSDATELPRPKTDCGQEIVKAEARTKYISSPGYPKPFPGDAKCIWAIYAEPGKRIRMEFQKFFLLQPILSKCEYHYVIVKSPFSAHTMGPYCGETGLPTIVSTGNLIYVELHTIVSVTTDNYQGFKLAFKETVESSSYELRSDNSAEDLIATVDPDTMNYLSPTVAPSPTPKLTKSTTKPWRFRPSRKPLNPLQRQNNVRMRPSMSTRRPTRTPIKGNKRLLVPPSTKTRVILPNDGAKSKFKIEVIIAISIGALILIAIVIVIALKLNKHWKKGKESSASMESNGAMENIINKPLPVVMHPTADSSYHYYAMKPEVYTMKPVVARCASNSVNGEYPTETKYKSNRQYRKRRQTR